jgi:serine/threonine protein kinase/tetratricopeptide (TPR) repeat protein
VRVVRESPATIIEDATPSHHQGSGSSSRHRIADLPRTVDGHEIISLLGYGGMGAVYLAYEPLMDRVVALKLLTLDPGTDGRSAGTERFLSEAVLTARLGHAGVIPIHRTGFDSSHGYYYTMRYVAGQTLLDILKQLAARDVKTCETFSINRLLGSFVKICEAIGSAHRMGIVHRDIKPANIMVAEFGEVLVLDWGLAKEIGQGITSESWHLDPDASEKLAACRRKRTTTTQLFLRRSEKPSGISYLKQLQASRPSSERTPITRSCQILGTPGYLSPEQAEGSTEVTPASDVYSLGVLLYELLTLHLPIESIDSSEVLTKTALGNIVPIKQRSAALRLPDALCDIAMRAIALKPEERYRNAQEMAEDVSLYLEGKGAWKTMTSVAFETQEMPRSWSVAAGKPDLSGDGMVLSPGARACCDAKSLGDFRFECDLWAEGNARAWVFAIGISELHGSSAEVRHQFRIGMDGRPFVELMRSGKRVQRRFDVRLLSAQKLHITIEKEQDRLRLFIEGRKYLDYREAFPHNGGAVEISAESGRIHVTSAKLESRGAPLNLSFMVLPDRLYRAGKFAEARELYRQLASSHSDREEGLMAAYKAGLCSVELDDQTAAFSEFTTLEGTMLDHCCALGLAHIGLRDGNIDWAWEALKNGHRRHAANDIRSDMWFALLSLVENLEASRAEEKVRRYEELLTELKSEPNEAAQLAFQILDTVQQSEGVTGLKRVAKRLLSDQASSASVTYEALVALGNAGIDEESVAIAADSLDGLLSMRNLPLNFPRLQILRAEVCLAQGNLEAAASHLRDAVTTAGLSGSDGLWARGWQILINYLRGDYQQALTDAHVALARFGKAPSSHVSYFHLLEALACFARNKPMLASGALAKACESDAVWKVAAMSYIKQQPAGSFENATKHFAGAQISECCFLTGEMFYRAGCREIAAQYFSHGLKLPVQRAMISRLARLRLNELSAGPKPAGGM